MLTKPSNTQVYSPFGTYVVEQHDRGFDRPQRTAVPEPAVAAPPQAEAKHNETESKDIPQAA